MSEFTFKNLLAFASPSFENGSPNPPRGTPAMFVMASAAEKTYSIPMKLGQATQEQTGRKV